MFLYKRIFEEFNRRGVRYVLVGGYAVLLHGIARFTADADVVLSFEEANVREAIDALTHLGLSPRVPVDPLQFADEEIRRSWIEDKGLMVFTMIDPSNPFFTVDLFVNPPISFEDLDADVVVRELEGVPVRVCSKDHLIAMKEGAGRPEDLSDVEKLKEIENE